LVWFIGTSPIAGPTAAVVISEAALQGDKTIAVSEKCEKELEALDRTYGSGKEALNRFRRQEKEVPGPEKEIG
jgi:hypothetical protein